MVENKVQVVFIGAYPENIMGTYKESEWTNVKLNASVCSLSELNMDAYKTMALSTKEKDIVMGEYVRDNKHVYMFFNEHMSKKVETKLHFKQSGNIYRYDALHDELFESDGHLSLTPYESSIYVVCDEVLPAKKEKNITYKTVELPNKWAVKYTDSMSYPDFSETVDTDRLTCVQMLDNYENKAGTVQYSTKINLEKKSTVLDLGRVHETAQVFVNNQLVDTRICFPYTFDLTDYIQSGENEIKIEVTNTLGTQQRDYLSHFLMIEPFGVEGPVLLMQGD